jgi:hypothetical protein
MNHLSGTEHRPTMLSVGFIEELSETLVALAIAARDLRQRDESCGSPQRDPDRAHVCRQHGAGGCPEPAAHRREGCSFAIQLRSNARFPDSKLALAWRYGHEQNRSRLVTRKTSSL